MRLLAAPWAAVAVAAAALLGLSGCAALPFGNKSEAQGQGPAVRPTVRLYTFSVASDAPAVRTLLESQLDLARFQLVPEGDAITPLELDRLAAGAPGQARALLETEGWFEPEVTVVQTPAAQTGGLPHVAVVVVPGPRTRVGTVAIESREPLAPSADDRGTDRAAASAARLDRLRAGFPLRPGRPFRQDDWTTAKNASLAGVRSDGHATATWRETKATVDVERAVADLMLELAPGPLYRLGAIRIEGIERYDATTVRNLATFRPGAVYAERTLVDYQARLLKSGLFEGASVEVDTEAADPATAPVTVRVKELTRHQATFGVGYSADTGPRFSVEAWDRRLFGRRIVGRGKLEVGPELRAIGGEATSYPDADLWRRFLSAQVEQLLTSDEERNSAFLRAGRSKDDGRFDRLLFAEVQTSRVGNETLATSARSVTGNVHWLMRDVDNVLAPVRGQAIAVQAAAGFGQGSETVAATGQERSARGPIGRLWTRMQFFRPLGADANPWFGQARVEFGQVFARARYGVPDPLLFRAGGDDSVRGYGYRDLGPEVAGQTVSGRVIATGTLEVARPVLARLPDLLGAVFVDAGNAADRWGDWKPVVGLGVGLRYRSPVGPIRLDIAYGEATGSVRLHFSAGVRF